MHIRLARNFSIFRACGAQPSGEYLVQGVEEGREKRGKSPTLGSLFLEPGEIQSRGPALPIKDGQA